MSFTIATWNINSVRLRMPLIEQFLQSHAPDVLCLQETKCADAEFPANPLNALGYTYQAIHGQKGYHGVAILSRLPLEDTSKIDFCAKGDARHVQARVKTKQGNTITVHSLYVPAGGDEPNRESNEKFAHKLDFVEEMRSKLRAPNTGDDHHLVLGDLNIAPLESDVWSHKQLLKVVSHTPIETELFEDVRQHAGWRDVMRDHFGEEETLFTWWSYRARDWAASNRGRRLDHVWANASLADKRKDCTILTDARGWERPSDHVPVITEFDI